MDGAPVAFDFDPPLAAQPVDEPLVAELQPEIELAANEPELAVAEDAIAELDQVDELDQVAELEFDQVTDESVDSVMDEQVAAGAAETGQENVVAIDPRVSWPHFMSQTSALMDRALEGGNLFTRIAAQKDALIEMGVVESGRRLSALPQVRHEPPIEPEPPIAPEPVVAVAPRTRIEMNEQVRIDLMAMRVRLIEDDGSAREIAEMLEAAVDNGLQSPLAMRVLGEAYLKLGMVERAAAQFRQAMLTRRGA